MLPVATDYPFLDILGSMLFFFGFIIWLSLLFSVFGDIFRRHDISGWSKAGWVLLAIVLPFLGVLIYLGTQGKGMADRKAQEIAGAQAQFDQYVRETAGSGGEGGAAAEIAKAKQLLDSGTITQAEFDDLKRKALA
jgi:Short C-terminal domain/Phospholipase_D-nuclease N-terminal